MGTSLTPWENLGQDIPTQGPLLRSSGGASSSSSSFSSCCCSSSLSFCAFCSPGIASGAWAEGRLFSASGRPCEEWERARLRCGVVGDKLQRDVSSAPDVVNYHQDLPGMSVLSSRCQDANYALTAGQRRAGCGAAPRGSNLRQRGPSGDEHQGRIRRGAGQLGPYALGRRAACVPGRGSAPGW